MEDTLKSLQNSLGYLRQSYGPIMMRPLTCFLFPATSEITGFDMIHTICIEDKIIAPTSASAVAIIQGLDVGYFESWALASLYVGIIGAVYSFHSTIRDARICYLRTLIGGIVCFIHNEGLSESVVSPCIPNGWSENHW
ncbi:hypothetical protein BT96DRAFT_1006632 [Gymnopus androsaceus JB14]|uniref:Uncharacterized protein n=1 Tax=Gymnopus androsaceus JB14 TaxID=1447944 RepID=A0A6A4GK25_9AGAR|nr:hypothetical protein BT96DRAFT_1006632 [Gymnopus androsaceus JB14]